MTDMKRRDLTRALTAGLLAFPLAARAARLIHAPVRVLVGFPPGGATDVVARAIVDKLGKVLDEQVFFVENRPGAGGQIAAQQLKAAAPDGTTIMLSIDHTQIIVPLTIAAAGYHPDDFTALAGVASYYNVLAVNVGINVKSMAELGAWVRNHPNEANYGVPAAGSVPQFIGHIVGKSFGVPMNPVPYKGGAPMVQDLLAGQVPIAIASMTEFIEHHRAGRARILGCSGVARGRIAPEIPTFLELGLDGIDKNPWLAFFGPKGMPPAFVARFDAAVKSALAQPQLQEKLAKMGNEVNAAPASEVRQWVAQASRHWGQVIREAGFEPQ